MGMATGVARPNSKGVLRTLPERPHLNHNVTKGSVYVFGADDVCEEEINTDGVIELTDIRPRSRGKPLTRPRSDAPQYIERDIEDGDTIRSLALKYGCQAAELKRVNNLISDQDFYGLQSIKVPVKRHGYLTELLKSEKKSKSNKLNTTLGASHNCDEVVTLEDEDSDVTDYEDSDQRHLLGQSNVRTVSIRDTLSRPSGEAVDFLQRMDKDIRHIVTSTKSRLDSLDEVKSRLTCRRFFPLESQKANVGADCGIRWWSIVAVMFLIGFVTPLLYFVYYEYIKPPS